MSTTPSNTSASPTRSASSHAAALIAGRVAAAALSVVTTFVVLYAMSQREYGVFVVATGIAGVLVVIADLGLTSSLARYLARGEVGRTLMVRVVLARALIATVAAGGLVLFGELVRRGVVERADADEGTLAMLFFIAAALVITQNAASLAIGLLPTMRRIRMLVALTVVQPLLELVGIIVASWFAWGAGGVIAASALAAALVAIVGIGWIVANMPRTVEVPVAARAVARYSGPLFIVWVCFAVFGQVDQLVIWALMDSADVATYAINWRLIALLHIPGLAIASIVAPRLVNKGTDGMRTFVTWLRWLAIAYVGIVGVSVALAHRIVELFPDAYAGAAPVFAALGGYAFLLGIAPLVTMGANFLGGARQRLTLSVAVIALNVGLDLALVPFLGLYGAAIATTVAFAGYVAGHAILSYELLHDPASSLSMRRLAHRYRGRLRAAPTRMLGVAAWPVVALAVAGAVAVSLTIDMATASLVAGLERQVGALVALATAGLAGIAAYVGLLRAGWALRGERFRLLPTDHPETPQARTHETRGLVVLHVCDFAAPYPGAFIRQLRMLAHELAERGPAQVHVALPARAQGTPWVAELAADGIELHLLPEPANVRAGAAARPLQELIARLGVQIVHSHFGGYDVAVARAVRRTPRDHRPVQVWHYRTALEGAVSERSLPRRCKDLVRYRWYGRHVDRCVGVTEAMADEAAARGMGSTAVAIVAGCDTDTFRADEATRRRVRSQLGIADDAVQYEHWHRKGGDLLAAAARSLEARSELPEIVYASIGAPDGEVEAPVRALPATRDVHELHQAADIFVSASRSEGFGNGLVEAFACERVAVAALAGGQREIFDGLEGCVAVAVEDAGALAEGLVTLIEQRTRWSELGSANRAYVVEHYSMRRWARQMADEYARLLAEPVDTAVPAGTRKQAA